jgi:hypothetical protein
MKKRIIGDMGKRQIISVKAIDQTGKEGRSERVISRMTGKLARGKMKGKM